MKISNVNQSMLTDPLSTLKLKYFGDEIDRMG